MEHEEAEDQEHETRHVRHKKVKHHVEVEPDDEVVDETSGDDPVVAPLVHHEVPATPVAAPSATVATVGVPATATDELSRLMPANGQVGVMTLLFAVVAVLGGGAAWKFYSQRSKEKHEEKLKEMELQASQPQTQHPSCKAENEATQGELRKLNESVGSVSTSISDVSQRVATLESKLETPELPEGLEDMEDRLKKLEKAVKPVKPTRSRAK